MGTQHQNIIQLHKGGEWHCSTEYEYIRDHRKRISELNRLGYKFEAKPCNFSKHNHNSRLFMRRLITTPEEISNDEWWLGAAYKKVVEPVDDRNKLF